MIQTLSTIQEPANGKKTYTSIALYILGIGLIGILVFFGGEIIKNFDNLKSKSAVTIDSLNQTATVLINDKEVGTTPYESTKIKPGENKIALKTDTQTYETNINFISNSKDTIYNVGIFRDLGISSIFSSGQEFWYEKANGNTIKIISNPSGASVYIDGIEIGKTPYSSNTLSPGSYDLEISYAGYETQKARINIEKDHTLNINFKLFPLPIPSNVKKFEGSSNLYAIFSDNEPILSNTQIWVEAIAYWNKTRGISLEDMGANKEPVFDFFIDYKGNLFNQGGKMVAPEELEKVGKGAYLGRLSDGETLTQEAKDIYLRITSQAVTGNTVTVKETGLGWLRVRSGPSINSEEVTKVNVGETFDMLDEQSGWIKIKIDETTTGWTLKDYLSIN